MVLSTGLLKRQSWANSWDHLTSVLTVSVHLRFAGDVNIQTGAGGIENQCP